MAKKPKPKPKRKTHAPHRRPRAATLERIGLEERVAELYYGQHMSSRRIAEVLSISHDRARDLVRKMACGDDPPLREPAAARNAGWDFSSENLPL